ncbi:MAG: putative Ig domain-containing protein, partial [Anaerolineaceae bacterium]|nr:putative Ig domain-containing protein [Anaerolineaceae bacterium]
FTNHPPSIIGPAVQSVVANSAYSFFPSASDPDGDVLTFSITNQPAWAAFDPLNGSLSGTPSNADVGSSAIVISVSDGLLSADLSFTLTVSDPVGNRPPVISGPSEQFTPVGSAYSFTPLASDPDGDALIFSVFNLPSWLSFTASTGSLNGTPGNGNTGVYTITIAVSDGMASALYTFTLTVTAASPSPVVSGVISITPAITQS